MAKRAPVKRRPRKAKPGTRGLEPAECPLNRAEGSAAEAEEAVEQAGGCVVGVYKEPLGGHQTLLSIQPIDKIEPTPFQRDLSDAHHKRLANVINKTGRFLDPVITVMVQAVASGRPTVAIVSKLCAVWGLNPSPLW
jgi:ParB family transcriptional regulator, chromosome partitioning protein